jgi:hypothetical protein
MYNCIIIYENEAKLKHGNDAYKYDGIEYISGKTKIAIVCNSCSRTIYQQPERHLAGDNCKDCALLAVRMTTAEFIQKSIEGHSKYPNQYDYFHTLYVNARTKVKIRCIPCDTFFTQRPDLHMYGHGCKKCGRKKQSATASITTEEFITRSREIHGEKYGYDDSIVFGTVKKVTIFCRKCEIKFEQRPTHHMHQKHGCPRCNFSISKPETRFLDLIGIPLENRQVRIGKHLCDGFDPVTNTVYELDGDFFHGNPAIYPPEGRNRLNKKTYGELYQKTLTKRANILALGYTK